MKRFKHHTSHLNIIYLTRRKVWKTRKCVFSGVWFNIKNNIIENAPQPISNFVIDICYNIRWKISHLFFLIYDCIGRECELWVIIEYCSNGNLLQFLRNRRDIYETEWKAVSKDPNQQLTMTDLVIAAYQVARGMEFLASRMVS